MKRIWFLGVFALLLSLSQADATDWPTRPITIVVPFAAGGPNDVLTRVIAQKAGEILGQSVIVENIQGGGGMTGARRVADAAADGYTVLLGSVGTQAQNQTLYAHPLYDAEKDFSPVILVAELPIALVVSSKFPAKNLAEFDAYTKGHQSEMTFASAGAGSATHLACVLFNKALGVDVTHVPFRGGGPALQEVVAGRISYTCDIVSNTKPMIAAGSVKALALLSARRSAILPDVPTAIEQGLNVEAYTWNAFFLPKNAPKEIIAKLHDAINTAIDSTWAKGRLTDLGAVLVDQPRRSPEYLAKFVHEEIIKWRAPILAAGIQQ